MTDLDDHFAAIAWHSVKHLGRPGAALAHAATLLQRGSLVIVVVPNLASVQDSLVRRTLARARPAAPPRACSGWHGVAWYVQRGAGGGAPELLAGGQGTVGMLHAWSDVCRAGRTSTAHGAAASRHAAVGHRACRVAGALSGSRVALRRSGTIYVEARRG